jgi:lysophospholipid acyltransferase (LPLAT)-like uncharacterized protein
MRPPQKSGVVVPHRLRWHEELLAFTLYAAIRIVSATWRLNLVTPIPEVPAPVIFCLWHNRLALCMKIHKRYAKTKWPGPGLAALISASKDGALLARVLKYFDVTAIRGSSSRRGRQALLEITGKIQDGFHAAITPDGPKGPKYRVQEGVIALAQVTGARIIPVSLKIVRKFEARSWDNFQIPMPFTRCDLYVGSPLTVPREVDEAGREALRQELEKRLMDITFD